MTFANPTDRWITGHLSDRLDVVCNQQRPYTSPRSGECCLGARVTAADHDNIKLIWIFHRSGDLVVAVVVIVSIVDKTGK